MFPVSTDFHTFHTKKKNTWLQALFTPPPLSGCTGRRWRRCPGGWPERPSPSCSPGRSLPRCGRPVAPPSAPRPGAGCSAPPCLPGRRWAGRSLRKAVAGAEGARGRGSHTEVRSYNMRVPPTPKTTENYSVGVCQDQQGLLCWPQETAFIHFL